MLISRSRGPHTSRPVICTRSPWRSGSAVEETLTGVAECGDGKPRDSLRGGAVCAIVGGTASHLALHGNNVLVMRIPGGADLWAPGPKETRHDTVKNPFGSDDEEMRLARTDLKQCEDLAFDQQKPLRQHEP